MTEVTKVIFRKHKETGDIEAFFPELPGSSAYNVTCYAHIGQHGIASEAYAINDCAPAKPEEYAKLKQELETIGYNLHVVKRFTQGHFKARQAEMRKARGDD